MSEYTSDVEVHLIRAARELLAAAKSVIEGLDAALEVMEERAAAGAKPRQKIEPIPIRRTTTP